MENEIWKSLSELKGKIDVDFDELKKDYQISNLGNFRTINSEGEIEEGHITISESQATITVGKKQLLLHRVVAMLFIENQNPEDRNIVIYLDGDITNNRVENLKWVSISERNERRYINQRSTKNVRCIDEDKIFASTSSAALYYGVPVDIIRYSIETKTECFKHSFEYCEKSKGRIALYLSTRRAKSLSNMLTNIAELRNHFIEVEL